MTKRLIRPISERRIFHHMHLLACRRLLHSSLIIGLIGFISFIGEDALALREDEYASEGKICYNSAGRRGVRHCRDPESPDELRAAQRKTYADSLYSSTLGACEFSTFRGWPAEVDRLTKKLSSEISWARQTQQDLYWAQQDIDKERFLSSEVVRNAYQARTDAQQQLLASKATIATLQWCVRCANEQKNGRLKCIDP